MHLVLSDSLLAIIRRIITLLSSYRPHQNVTSSITLPAGSGSLSGFEKSSALSGSRVLTLSSSSASSSSSSSSSSATSSSSTKHVPTTSSPPPHSNSSSSSSSTPSPSSPNPSPPPNSSSSSSPSSPPPRSPIQSLMSSPTLFSPLLPPRHPIILSHGLYGFDVRGPSAFPRLQMHYWSNVLGVLRGRVGAEVIVAGVPGTGSIVERAEEMHRFLREKAKGRNINFLAHSMGGLDCRHVITHIRPTEYHPISLTTISTPHRGSPFMDWCLANIGIGSPRRSMGQSSATSSSSSRSSSSSSHSRESQDRQKEEDREREAKERQKEREENEVSETLKTLLPNPPPYSLKSPLLTPRPSPSTSSSPSSPSTKAPSSTTASSTPSPSSSPLSLPSLSLKSLTSLPSAISSLPSSLSALPKSLTSFAILPSSFTTLLLSLIDSPAYSNLTTSFLASFNERTPDVEGVKYFSVAARIQRAGKGKGGMGIWHPLWFPKIILDASEERERELLLGGQKSPSTNSNSASEKRGMQSAGAGIGRETGNTGGRESGGREWGNDGLVTIESAKWGEFLGVLEGCDHWEMRGARGIGQDWDFFSSSGLGKYVGWSKNIGKDRAKAGEGRNTEGKAGRSEGKGNVNVEERGIVDNGVESKGEREEREREIKASTDSLSAVVDWIVDHMPASSSGSSSSSSLSSSLSDSPSSPSSKSSKSSKSSTSATSSPSASTNPTSSAFSSAFSSAKPNAEMNDTIKSTAKSQIYDPASNPILASASSHSHSSSSSHTHNNYNTSHSSTFANEREKEKDTGNRGRGEGGKERHDLATKFDLERFYVALCRKLYEEGL